MYRVRYRFCDRDADEGFHLPGGAEEQADIHNGLIHHHDGRECATVEVQDEVGAPREATL